MNCDEARRALLDAEPDELSGTLGGPLSLHLQHCDACRADAAAIIARTDALRASLVSVVAAYTGELQSAHAAQAALREGVAVADVARTDDAHVDATYGDATSRIDDRHRRTRRIGRRVLPPLAIAAALAALLLVDRGTLRLPFADPPLGDLYVPQPSAPDAPVVNAVGASGVAVMPTINPKITVVWTF